MYVSMYLSVMFILFSLEGRLQGKRNDTKGQEDECDWGVQNVKFTKINRELF